MAICNSNQKEIIEIPGKRNEEQKLGEFDIHKTYRKQVKKSSNQRNEHVEMDVKQ